METSNNKKLKKITPLNVTFVISILISVVCLVSYNVIGSSVAPDGTLVEPFALIPVGIFFEIIAIITGVRIIVKLLRNRKCK